MFHAIEFSRHPRTLFDIEPPPPQNCGLCSCSRSSLSAGAILGCETTIISSRRTVSTSGGLAGSLDEDGAHGDAEDDEGVVEIWYIRKEGTSEEGIPLRIPQV